MNSCYNGGLAAQFSQSAERVFDVVLIIVLGVGEPEEKSGLGHVGDNKISLCAELLHLFHELVRKACIELACVAENRVYYYIIIICSEIIKKVGNYIHLFHGAQISCVQSIKVQIHGLPV